jgi:hypothetical protein
MDWVKLKEWVNEQLTINQGGREWDDADNAAHDAFESVLDKMNELENEDFFYAYTDQDGYELIQNKFEDGVAVWLNEHKKDECYKVRVKKSAINFYDEEDKFYDCDYKGIEVLEQIR